MADFVPKHLAFIMDGNRRWAKEQGLPTAKGHQTGYERAKDVGDWCLDRGIKYLTLFAFSSENWKRAPAEVEYILGLLLRLVNNDVKEFNDKGVRIRIIGRRDRFADKLVRAIEKAEESTAGNERAMLSIAFNYGGRNELVDAVKSALRSGVGAEELDDEVIAKHLYTPDAPDPEMVIRTGGELRLSNFLPWQTAYSELYFTKTHWPAFSEQDLDKALETFAARERRYGK